MRTRHRTDWAALASLLLLFGAAPARAQFFNAVTSRDAYDVIAVADSGALFRSLDGGSTWSSSTLGSGPLRGVAARGFTIVAVGDSGHIWRSTDNGGTWSLQTAPGAPSLRRVESASNDSLFAVGAGGTVLLSIDGGATWSAQASGTGVQLNAVRFRDARNGWIAGASGFLANTADGGANWTPVPLGTANVLECVDSYGLAVWAVGDDATAFRSIDGGVSFAQLDLHADLGPDVRAVWLQSADSVYIAGGGGFIRRSADGGATWQFLVHTLQGGISDLHFVGPNGWAASPRVRAVMRTTDGGDTWAMPSGSVATRNWVQKIPFAGSVRGATVAVNPLNKNTVYCALGNIVYRSFNEGESWIAIGNIPGVNTYKTNAFVVSPKDSNYFIAASGIPNRIVYSPDAGVTWNVAYAANFGEYGIPLEMDPDRPDTLYLGLDNDVLYRSIDRGQTFQPWSTTIFRSPCDIVVVPESGSSVIEVGDGITGSGQGKLWRSANSTEFTTQATVAGSEVPGLSCSRLRNWRTFATNWSTGGVERTSDYGLTWPRVHTTGSTWGTDIARDDPNVVLFGLYSGGIIYMSFQGGDVNTFTTQTGIAGSNYSVFARDRALMFATQSGGLFKLGVTQTMPITSGQSLALSVPDGGEVWAAGSVHTIQWSAPRVALARIEYRTSYASPWQHVADVEGYKGSYDWTVPNVASGDAMIRVSDAWDGSPADSSSAAFTIALPLVSVTPAAIDFGPHAIGSAALDSVVVANTGTASLDVSSITVGGSAFHPGRSMLTLAPGARDTIGVTFLPSLVIGYGDTLTMASNAYNAASVRVPLAGAGTDTLRLHLTSPVGGEIWQYASNHLIQWQSALVSDVDLAYQTAPASPWISIADSVAAAGGAYLWLLPNAPATQARVRVLQHEGPARDSSALGFGITVPGFAASPSPLDLGQTPVSTTISDTLHLSNPGSAPVSISLVACSKSAFWPGRTSLVIPPGASDTLGVYFHPTIVGRDTAMLTFSTNAASGSGNLELRAEAISSVAVTGIGLPTAFTLSPNRPNPFSRVTLIRYALPVRTEVRLDVFNLQGQLVATLVRGEQGPGNFAVPFEPGVAPYGGWSTESVRSGIYIYRLRAGEFSATRKMLLMR